ncbi:MAG: ThiF family adenylyltransferase, partial [Muribaculaceae bacterium]|nr:ThiF family adenylyltransferase [Muribaculaceae bacterium]
VGALTLVDADRVSVTNINRQAPATTATVGEPKVAVMARRLLEINPSLKLELVEGRYTADTADSFDLGAFDAVVDAIDSLADKALLILRATEAASRSAVRPRRPFFVSSMGAALKLDPAKIAVAEFWKVSGCPLGAALRNRFKRMGRRPSRKFQCVYSPELLPNKGEAMADDPSMSYGKLAVNGSLCHITAIFGMTLAGLVVEHLVKE